MGGVALNCVANSLIYEKDIFKNIWIMSNPGDAGSSLGAPALYYFEAQVTLSIGKVLLRHKHQRTMAHTKVFRKFA